MSCDISPPDKVPDGSNTSPAKETDRIDTCLSNVTCMGGGEEGGTGGGEEGGTGGEEERGTVGGEEGGTMNGRFKGLHRQTFFAF